MVCYVTYLPTHREATTNLNWRALRIPALAVAGVLVAGVAFAGHLTYKGYNVVHVLVNGQELAGEVPAINFDGSTMMPVRAISEALGARVGWNGETQTVTVDTPDGAVAVVNGRAISGAELNARLQTQFGQQVLGRMIEEVLIQEAAAKAGVTVTAAEAAAELEKVRARMGAQQLAEALRQNNLTEVQYLGLLETELLARKVVGGMAQAQIKDADVSTYLAENQLRIRYANSQVRASHILVETEAEAQQVIERLAKGEAFADLAAEISIDPSAKTNKGDLDFFGPGAMVAEFEEAAFALKVGERSAPVKSPFGWHVILVTDRMDGAVLNEAEALAAARSELIDQYVRSAISPWVRELKAKAQIQTNLK